MRTSCHPLHSVLLSFREPAASPRASAASGFAAWHLLGAAFACEARWAAVFVSPPASLFTETLTTSAEAGGTVNSLLVEPQVLPVLLSFSCSSVWSDLKTNVWLANNRLLTVNWSLFAWVEKLLLFMFVLAAGSVDKEEADESWLKSGSWWTLDVGGSLSATWLLAEGWLTSLLRADCQLLEQRTAGILKNQLKIIYS